MQQQKLFCCRADTMNRSRQVTTRCEAIKTRLGALDLRLHDTLLQAEDLAARNWSHSTAHKENERMAAEIEGIIAAAHAPRHNKAETILKEGSSTWTDNSYVVRGDSLEKFAAQLQKWQVGFQNQGLLPDACDVRTLWAKVMAVEVKSAEDRRFKNELMYGSRYSCQFFYENS